MIRVDLHGYSSGRLVVKSEAQPNAHGHRQWLCLCECGRETILPTSRLTSGNTRSCGCLKLEAARAQGKATATHGHTFQVNGHSDGSPTYRSWMAMKTRCLNPRHKAYAKYGGAGVSICQRWLLFVNFLSDMGERPLGTSIDRIDGRGNYEPGNCRWATPSEQNRNRRRWKLS